MGKSHSKYPGNRYNLAGVSRKFADSYREADVVLPINGGRNYFYQGRGCNPFPAPAVSRLEQYQQTKPSVEVFEGIFEPEKSESVESKLILATILTNALRTQLISPRTSRTALA